MKQNCMAIFDKQLINQSTDMIESKIVYYWMCQILFVKYFKYNLLKIIFLRSQVYSVIYVIITMKQI